MGKIADLSHYNGDIDWNKARKELDMVIFRASVGMNADKKYPSYSAECGLPYGVYHYVKAGSAEEARKEARFFVECAGKAALLCQILKVVANAVNTGLVVRGPPGSGGRP